VKTPHLARVPGTPCAPRVPTPAHPHLRAFSGLRAIVLGALLAGIVSPLLPAPGEANPPSERREKRRAKRSRAAHASRANKQPADTSAPATQASAEAKPSTETKLSAPAETDPKAGASRAESQRRAAQDAALGTDTQVVREGETNVKVMSFSGLDIEGRLKSPQLMYFVGRVHAEFDKPTLPHRSFMPELEATTHRGSLR
jgi:hypothetical protein